MECSIVIASFWEGWFSQAALQDFSLRFLSVLFEGLPFIFIGTLISGLIDVYLPSSLMDKLLPKNRFVSILTCGLLGLLIPVCECTVVPVIRRLVAKGLPIGSAFAYMLAAPIVNPITIISTFTAFNGSWEMALSRALMGYSVAVCVGVLILFLPLEKILKQSLISRLNFSGREKQKAELETVGEISCSSEHDTTCCGHDHSEEKDQHEHSDCEHQHSKCNHDHHDDHSTCDHDHKHQQEDRLVSAMRVAMRDFIDVAVYFIIGVSLVTLLKDTITEPGSWVSQLAGSGEVQTSAFMMGLAFVLSLCSTSDAFVVATSFGEKFGRASKMAFLVFGPMMDVKLMFLYQTLMRWRAVLGMAVVLFILVGVFTLLWDNVYFEWLSPILFKE